MVQRRLLIYFQLYLDICTCTDDEQDSRKQGQSSDIIMINGTKGTANLLYSEELEGKSIAWH